MDVYVSHLFDADAAGLHQKTIGSRVTAPSVAQNP